MDKYVYDYNRYVNEPEVYEVVVVGDTNDADYITATNKTSMKMIEEVIKPAAELLKTVHGRVPWSEYNSDRNTNDIFEENEELFDIFQEFFAPHGEHGIHTVESIHYYPLPDKVQLL